MKISHCGDLHVEEDRYFADTAQCLEWFVEDSIRANTDLFVVDGDLTTYKQTIKERNLWVDLLIQMGNHAPVILVAGNHGKELDGDLHVLARAKAAHSIYLCTEPDTIEIGEAVVAVFPYPRKAEVVGNEHSLGEAFARQLDEFSWRFEQRPGCNKLFFGHFGVAGARVSSGQPLVGRCAEYPLDPLRGLRAHVGDDTQLAASEAIERRLEEARKELESKKAGSQTPPSPLTVTLSVTPNQLVPVSN